MARDLSVQQPVQPLGPLPPSQQCGQGPHGDRAASHNQHHRGARTPSPDRLTYSTSESEGDGGGDSDESFDHVGEQQQDRVSQDYCDGLQGGVGDEGEQLYRQFLARRMAEEQYNYPRHFQRDMVDQGNLSTDLATLAERFSRSMGREQVRQRAEQVELGSITQDNFTMLLTELFHDGGITQERILVLFFFCSDLAIRAVRSGLSSVLSSLTRWTVAFLRGTVAAWVRCRGGWSRVLSGGVGVVNQLAFIGACAAVIGVCAVYIRKNL
eukprot:GFUD01031668.1.p1 GENE.GFUD01031668.1~~GFUD01031668.1.p1  ORF type:complete len:268 (+),score=79.41 GFUD01031668.1:143-946(+)